jgi:hypothetical protein
MKKGIFLVLGLMFLAAAMVILPGAAKAEMYVEAYIGGVQGANSSINSSISHPSDPRAVGAFGTGTASEVFQVQGGLDPAVLGGMKVGTWFVKEGTLGYDYPDWMKYLGFYLDFSYHRLNFANQPLGSLQSTFRVNSGAALGTKFPTTVDPLFGTKSSSEGDVATLAFMFAARYGFLRDDEVPFGRLQPYIAVGPAIFFSSQQFVIGAVRPFPFIPLQFTGYTAKMGTASATNIGLAAETGFRYMALKNVSIDISFKYRYAQPSYSYTLLDPWNNIQDPGNPLNRTSVTMSPTYNLFSGQVGVAYHF